MAVYLDYKSIFQIADTTYAAGSPGFQQYSQTTVTNNQVAAWRGYTAVSQDGIWQKQGIVVPAIAADLSPAHSTAFGIQCHSQILYEGNAQLLSGTVYKMWVDNKYDVYYLESLDGITWTRRSSPVLSGYADSVVVKNGSTYFLYAQLSANEGIGVVAVFTSSDGITWTQQSANCLTLGGAGDWDSTSVDPFFAITVQGGTFYGLYLGCKAGQTYFSTGLATSTDGITWTKYVSNPVLTGGNLCGLVKSGSTYYSWLQTTAAGRDAGAPFFDPAASVRYQSTDFINWTNPTPSIQNTQMFESLNTAIGYGTLVSVINIGGKAYAYITNSPGDTTQPIIGQIELAIGPSTIENIVTKPENATVPIATDSFVRADGSLGANWTTPAGGTALKIASHLAEPTATATTCQAVYTGSSFNKNQYSEVTIGALSDTSDGGLVVASVRADTASLTDYEAVIFSPAGTKALAAAIYKRVSGSGAQIGPTVTITPHVGDVFRLVAIDGSDGFPTLSLFQNGFLILEVQDTTATPIETGNPGVQAYATAALANSQISAWAGGNASVIPAYSSSSQVGAFAVGP